MRKSERLAEKQNIDYLSLHTTGKKYTQKTDSNSITELTQLLGDISISEINVNMEKLFTQVSILTQDILDFIDENPVDNSNEVTKYRTGFRTVHTEIKNQLGDEYDEKYLKDYNDVMEMVKSYIKSIKTFRSKQRNVEAYNEKLKEERKHKINEFMMTDILSSIKQLRTEFTADFDVSYEELLRRKSELPTNLKKLESIASMFKDVLQNNVQTDLDNIMDSYHELNFYKESYCKKLWKEIEKNDILKHESLDSIKLNIKIDKFYGYDSSVDIFTFKSNFEKVYKRSTPKNLLPDLLKFNYLQGPALALIKNVDDIDNIWDRLCKSYGNPKILLNKKLTNLHKINNLWKFKDPEKLIDGISSITNIMKDLIKLASDHGIEQRLYCGDGIERIYDLLGDTRLTRWFADISEKSLSDEELWNYLLKFLEKEIRVQQQKMLHGFSADIKKSTSDKPPEKRIVEKKKAYHSGINSFNASSSNPIIQNICFICG